MSRFPGDNAGEAPDYDHDVKVVVIGDGEVGKTSLMLRFTRDKFSESLKRTIGVDFESKIVECKKNTLNCQIWDTAGQDRFRGVASQYYRGCHGVAIVYDTTRKETFQHVQKWVGELDKHAVTEPIVTLWANKIDLVDHREVSTEEGQALAAAKGWFFIETSAAMGNNVESAFHELLERISDRLAPGEGGDGGGSGGSGGQRLQGPPARAAPAPPVQDNGAFKLSDHPAPAEKKKKKCC